MKKLLVALLLVATPAFAADTKVSAMPDGTPMQATDAFHVARAGADFKILGSDLCRVASCTMTAPILAATGTVSAPSYSFSADATTGLYQSSSSNINFAIAGTEMMRFTPTTEFSIVASTRKGSGGDFSWASSASPLSAAADTGLARVSAAVVKVTNGSTGNGSIQVTAVTDVQDTDTSISFGGANEINLNTGGGTRVRVNSTDFILPNATPIGWGSASFTPDTGLARVAAGNARATNGSTGLGYLTGGQLVEANTGTKSPTVIESGELYTNTGDADGSTVNLPDDPTIGAQYSVAVTVAQTITVSPNTGESLYLNAAACSSITSATIGAVVSIVATTGGSGALWMGTGSSWTCVP